MANLSPSTNIGGSASSLVRTAGSLASQINTFNDTSAAIEYENSGYTDAAFQKYQDYLGSRIKVLQGTGSIADATKAIEFSQKVQSAAKSNTSASITRENIQIMAGGATKQDKYNLITQQYVRAVNNGDLTLAQSLESQAYSLSQSIQLDQQNAADARTALAKSTGTSDAAHQQAIARNLVDSITQLNQDEMNSKTGGQQALNTAIKNWVNTNKDQILKLNPEAAPTLSAAIAKGAQPNYLDLVQGAVVAAANAHLLAATAEMPYNPDTAEGYIEAARNMLNGEKFSTLAGSFTYQEISRIAQEPNALTYNASTQRYTLNPVTGHIVDQVNGNGVIETRGTDSPTLTPQQIATLSKLNIEVKVDSKGGATDGITAKTTDTTPGWVQKATGKDGNVNIYNVNGNLQFVGQSRSGAGQDVYTIVKDANGRSALMGTSSKTDPLGHYPEEIVGAEPGFSLIQDNPAPHTSFLGRIGSLIGKGGGSIFGHFGGHASAQDLISGGQATEFQIAQANARAAAALLAYTPPVLPQIQQPARVVAPATPALRVSNVPSLQSITPGKNPAIAPKTVNPQQASGSPQAPNFNLQGGGGIRLQ
jgi:hypothetical protein